MMEVFGISEENIEAFRSLLGEDVADDMKRVYFRGIGARDDNGKALGAVAFELIDAESGDDTKSRIFLAKYRNEEAGSLLQEFYTANAVSEDEITESTYELPDEAQAEVFVHAGFTGGKKESDEIRITLGEIAKLDIAKPRNLPDYIGSIEDLSVLQYRNAVKKILFKGQKGILEDLAYLPKNWFDEQISACSVSDDEADGLFLVRRTPSGTLIPVLLYAYGPDYRKNLLFMIGQAARRALESCPPETPVLINRKNPATRALAGKLLPKTTGAEIFYGSRKE
ncbi:MAG: hypothetical protein IKO80_10960 [Lachnospiraceae bacterium]|nr:hypothetical protein [Lachnospiraceae bacterium]